MARKLIKKVAVSPIPEINGSVVDSFNVENKTNNAPSIKAVENYIKEQNTYSTEEQVVGKWIDGKTLYKRTYTSYTLQAGTNNIEYYIFDTDKNKNPKKVEGTVTLKSGGYYYTSSVPSGGVDFGATEFSKNVSSGALYIARNVKDDYETTGLEITMYYTKTTD